MKKYRLVKDWVEISGDVCPTQELVESCGNYIMVGLSGERYSIRSSSIDRSIDNRMGYFNEVKPDRLEDLVLYMFKVNGGWEFSF